MFSVWLLHSFIYPFMNTITFKKNSLKRRSQAKKCMQNKMKYEISYSFFGLPDFYAVCNHNKIHSSCISLHRWLKPFDSIQNNFSVAEWYFTTVKVCLFKSMKDGSNTTNQQNEPTPANTVWLIFGSDRFKCYKIVTFNVLPQCRQSRI